MILKKYIILQTDIVDTSYPFFKLTDFTTRSWCNEVAQCAERKQFKI